MIVNGPGNTYTNGIGKFFDPCCDVDAIAIHIILVYYDISQIYADTKFQRVVLVIDQFLPGKSALDTVNGT